MTEAELLKHLTPSLANLTLLRPDGAAFDPSEVAGRPLLLVFHRHIA
jgi:hypothetical protein